MIDTLSTVDFAVGSNPSGSSSDVGQATKKVRTKPNFLPDMDDPTANRNGQKVQNSNTTKVVDDVLLITFSNKVQEYIGRKMARTIVVKLLGRRIGFNALLNTISLLLSGLPEGYYSDCLLRAIRQLIGTMIKLDVHTISAHQGRFVRLAVSVYLRKPLVSKLQINGRL
ncbi:hypothetical protein Gotur_001564 [Gossypium turneri]